MFEGWKSKAGHLAELLIICFISINIFNYIVQPLLVSIDPIFAYQDLPLGEAVGRGPETPAELAGMISVAIIMYAYYTLRFKFIRFSYDP